MKWQTPGNFLNHITEILSLFIISTMIFYFMEKLPKIHDLVYFRKDKMSLLYDDLSNAIKERNVKSVWELSKMITRQHFTE